MILVAAAVGGQVAWLLLLSPDPWIVGFGQLPRPSSGRALVAVFLGAFLIAVIGYFLGSSRAARATIRPVGFRNATLLAALVGTVLTATAVSAEPFAYPLHAALTSLFVTTSWVAIALTANEAGALGMDSAVDSMLAADRTRWYLAGTAAAISIVLSRTVFDGIPHIPDEVVYLLQAKYLSAGNLYVSGIPPAALDLISTTAHEGRWFGIFPVGWPAILAAGVKVGLPWLVNPVLTGVVILLAHGLVRRVWDGRIANLTCFLLCASPWLLYLGASFMSHTASIAVALLAIRGAVEAGDGRGVSRWSLLGGVGLGALVLIRPFEGILIGLVCAGIVITLQRSIRPHPGGLLFGLSAVAVGALTLPYNRVLTGRTLLDPITYYFDNRHYPGSNRLGFGESIGNLGWGNDVLPGHSPLESVINASWNGALVQLELFGWAFGSIAVALLALGAWGRIGDRRMLGPLAIIAAVLVGYSLYWYSAADFGPRYWSQMIVPLSAVTAVALFRLPDARKLRRIVIVASLIGAPVVLVMRGTIKYREYRGMTRSIERLADSEDFGHDLILIRGSVFSDFSPGLILNPPSMDGPGPLYFRWVNQADLSVLRERFPDRQLWIVEGPSITQGEPRVVSGPTP